ncbi:MAG: response regulator transcription factor [Planctomycetes bacterium]|nr:response regulator transcription factor [Planctomycetota bacterium]
MKTPVILLVEDDARMALGLTRILESDGFQVIAAGDGAAALHLATERRHDLVILDAMLPRLDGFSVVRELRTRGDRSPVLMLTAKGAEADKVRGLELGADDYITKPFGVPELLARVRAQLRRARGGAEDVRRLDFPGLAIDCERQTVAGTGGTRDLSTHECGVLRQLAARPGELITRARLLETVWGDDRAVTARVIDWHVTNLRKKIESVTGDAEPRRILTVHGSGYKFAP